MRKHARQKAASELIKSQFKRLRDLEDKERELRKKIKELGEKKGIFKEMKKQDRDLCKRNWHTKNKILLLKREICANEEIVPLILVKKIYVN